ncbi:LLM class oxidoreductase [Terasakiella sp. A23]|uniref:LLM class oxidoreductase n=1 Tax=Terasakiella sp. FCG-A23 TaxID=3080561 RepID=UPI002955C699|nr:LLM class oxidoreductase [Terasakiella sp. A23]MDV7341043.1 LLM class oxidoreductase [Terasakiella sp. A23]
MTEEFKIINAGFNATYKPNKLSLGLVVPIEHYPNSPEPTMKDHIARVKLAEELGFATVWLRDVPFNVPSFGDTGQMYDPFVYLGFLAAQTEKIALGVGSIILPLRHPAHVAKAATSADVLSNGRLILGVASGDRPEEYPALNMEFENRGERFRHSMEYIQRMWEDAASFENPLGSPYGGIDMLPKPTSGRLPLMITGASQQSPDWLAANGDGWITYPRNVAVQGRIITEWRDKTNALGLPIKPASQSLYIDLSDNPDEALSPIHLGFRSGVNYLKDYLWGIQEIGINHVAINLRFNTDDMVTTLNRLAGEVLPEFRN